MNRYKTFEEYCDENKFYFPVVVETKYLNMTRVHPLKQKLIKLIVENKHILEYCNSLVLFGSSISMKCNNRSDLDLFIKLKDDNLENRNFISEIIGTITNWNHDVIWDEPEKNTKLHYKISLGVELLGS